MSTSSDQHGVRQVGPAEWVDRYGDALYRYAVHKVSCRDLAEDLVQETFLAALGSLERYRGDASELTWLIGILRRKIVDHFRRRERELPSAGLGTVDHLVEKMFTSGGHWRHKLGGWPKDPHQALQQQEFWKVLDECVGNLPPGLAAAFQLRDVQQTDTQTVCSELKISAANLSVRLHRARLLLRRCLELNWFCD